VDEAQHREGAPSDEDEDVPGIPEVSNVIPREIEIAVDSRRRTAPWGRQPRLNRWQAIFVSQAS
jgi:hypothetical protein